MRAGGIKLNRAEDIDNGKGLTRSNSGALNQIDSEANINGCSNRLLGGYVMAEDSGMSPWFILDDVGLVEKTEIFIEEDYDFSSIWSGELWQPGTAVSVERGVLAFKLSRGPISILDEYDIYPGVNSILVVSDRMRGAVEAVCSPKEVAFYPCQIHSTKGEVTSAWGMYPLHCEWCVDREKSKIVWNTPSLKPGEVSIKSDRYLALKEGCLGELNIIRLREKKSRIIISDNLKRSIELVNEKGIQFLRDYEIRI